MSKFLARLQTTRHYSRVHPPPPVSAPVIRVSNNIARLGSPKEGPKPRQLLLLPPFPVNLQHPLPGKSSGGHPAHPTRVTAITWLKYYFDEISASVVQSHFNKGLVHKESSAVSDASNEKNDQIHSLVKVNHNDVMEVGAKIHVPVSIAETKISKRFDTIPSGTLYPNADEIEYMQRLVMYKDSAIIILNKPPKLPVKGNLPVHNSMDALAAAALTYGNEEGPKLVHRLDRESSGILLMGRTKESISQLQWLFSDTNKAKSPYKSCRLGMMLVKQQFRGTGH